MDSKQGKLGIPETITYATCAFPSWCGYECRREVACFAGNMRDIGPECMHEQNTAYTGQPVSSHR